MFHKIVDVLKEVFWIKPSRRKSKPSRRKKAGKAAVKKPPVKKKIVKKSVKPVAKAKTKPAPKALDVIDPALVQVGTVTHYFDRIKVCVVKLTQGTVLIGDKLTIQGAKTKFVQKVWSMQIESEDVKVARKGQIIGLKVDKIAAVGDKVYK
jgi:translation initiation factor IF-2